MEEWITALKAAANKEYYDVSYCQCVFFFFFQHGFTRSSCFVNWSRWKIGGLSWAVTHTFTVFSPIFKKINKKKTGNIQRRKRLDNQPLFFSRCPVDTMMLKEKYSFDLIFCAVIAWNRALIITISYRAGIIGTLRHTPDPPTATFAAKLFLVRKTEKWCAAFDCFELAAQNFVQELRRTDWAAKFANSNRTSDAPSKPSTTANGRHWPVSARTSSKMTKG